LIIFKSVITNTVINCIEPFGDHNVNINVDFRGNHKIVVIKICFHRITRQGLVRKRLSVSGSWRSSALCSQSILNKNQIISKLNVKQSKI